MDLMEIFTDVMTRISKKDGVDILDDRYLEFLEKGDITLKCFVNYVFDVRFKNLELISEDEEQCLIAVEHAVRGLIIQIEEELSSK